MLPTRVQTPSNNRKLRSLTCFVFFTFFRTGSNWWERIRRYSWKWRCKSKQNIFPSRQTHFVSAQPQTRKLSLHGWKNWCVNANLRLVTTRSKKCVLWLGLSVRSPTGFVFYQQGAPGPVGPLGPAGPSGEKVESFFSFWHIRGEAAIHITMIQGYDTFCLRKASAPRMPPLLLILLLLVFWAASSSLWRTVFGSHCLCKHKNTLFMGRHMLSEWL